jgi:hypothetical protein
MSEQNRFLWGVADLCNTLDVNPLKGASWLLNMSGMKTEGTGAGTQHRPQCVL